MQCFYKQFPAAVCLDCGAESSLISESFAKCIGIKIQPTLQSAVQADVKTPLNIIGEIKNVPITRGSHTFTLDALVIQGALGSDIVAGEPFLEYNDIVIHSAKKQIIIKGKDIVPYSSTSTTGHPSTRRIQTYICRSQYSDTIFPGECAIFDGPPIFDGELIALEPRTNFITYKSATWPAPQITSVINGKLTLTNNTKSPICLKNNDHFCQVRGTSEILPSDLEITASQTNNLPSLLPQKSPHNVSDIRIDQQLPAEWSNKFNLLHLSYDSVFNPSMGRCTDAFGKVRARVNIGSVSPPNQKLRVPSYSSDHQQILQSKFDELEQQGVFLRLEDVDVSVEHVSPSFLVRKPSGGHRLATAFTTIGEYSKPLPTIMPAVDQTLQTIANWEYIIATDLGDAFYQIPLDKGSLKWCVTPTPFKCLRIYSVSA